MADHDDGFDGRAISRRAMLRRTGWAGVGTALVTTDTLAATPGSDTVGPALDGVLAVDIARMTVAGDIAAIRTIGHHLPGIGGALYVADGADAPDFATLTSRNGRRFRLADDEMRAIRPEVFGALGNCSVNANNADDVRFDGNDDTDALAHAWTIAMQKMGSVELAARRYRITRPLPAITTPIRVRGAGALKTWLLFDPVASGDLMTVQETWLGRDASEVGMAARSVAVPAGQSSGVQLEGFTIAGSRTSRNPQNGLMFYERNDNVVIRDVEIRHIKGRGFCSGISRKSPPTSLMRESRIDHLQVRQCGDAARRLPAFELSSDGYRPADDSSNNITITDLLVIYSSGKAIMMENRHPFRDQRYISIFGAYVEGSDDVLWTVRGSVTDLVVHGMELNACRNPAVAAMTFEAAPQDAVTRPPRTCAINGSIGPVANGVRVSAGKDIRFQFTQNAATGMSAIIEPGCVGSITFTGTGQERLWRYAVPPERLAQVSVIPNRQVWAPQELPPASTLLNATVTVRYPGTGRTAMARSNGVRWQITPVDGGDASPARQ